MNVSPKVQAAGAGAGAAGALTVILVWAAGALGLEVPPEVASAFTTLIAAGAGVAAGYMKADRSSWGARARDARGLTLVEALVVVFLILVILIVLFRLL